LVLKTERKRPDLRRRCGHNVKDNFNNFV